MKKFLLLFVLLVGSTSIPLFLSLSPSSNLSTDVLETDTETEATETETTPETDTTSTPLTDIQGHWAESSIESLQEKGVVNGYGNGLFGPNDKITRAQIMKIALKAFGQDTVDSTGTAPSSFKDVTASDWFNSYVETGAAIGIISGYKDGSFKPENPVTRAEALKIILEAAGFTDLTALTPNFTDVDTVTDWFAKYTSFAKTAELSTGYSDGSFRGNQPITRAEVCVLVQKVVDYLAGAQ